MDRWALSPRRACRALGAVGLLAGALLGCGDGGAGGAVGSDCQDDSDCPDGFCDRGECAAVEPETAGKYGASCVTPLRTPIGWADGKLVACGAYLCIEGRCRSCLQDEECQVEYGAPMCRQYGSRPGKTCGNYSQLGGTSDAGK